jgi:hypothetical protein
MPVRAGIMLSPDEEQWRKDTKFSSRHENEGFLELYIV